MKKAAAPATDKAVPPQEGPPSGGAEAPGADLEPPDPPDELPAGPEIVEGPKPRGTVDEAQSREHQVTHLPKNPVCDVCSKARIQRKPNRRK